MEYLLDMNICIYIIKKQPVKVFEKFNNIHPGSIGTSTITLAELQFGIAKSSNPRKNQSALNKFLSPLEIYEFDTYVTIHYGKIRSELEKNGTPIGPLDTFIAVHALSLDLIFVTNNEREFERIPGLVIENWTI